MIVSQLIRFYLNVMCRNKMPLLPVQRTLSLPKLGPSSDCDLPSVPYVMPVAVFAPPKPPRTALFISNGSSNLSDSKDRCDKAEIRNALQNWQMNVLMNEWEAKHYDTQNVREKSYSAAHYLLISFSHDKYILKKYIRK